MTPATSVVSIIIPAYRAEKTIGACLDGLLACPLKDYEIIVVADDETAPMIRQIAEPRGARVITPNRGAAAARNLGAENARGDILLFIDGDCAPEKDWAQAMITPLRDPEIVGACGMKRTHQRGIIPRFIQMEFDYRYDNERRLHYIDFIDSGTAAYRRDVFLKCGGFDTTLSDAEDTDLSYRLSEQGYRMAFADGAIVYHEHPSTLFEYLKRKFVYAYWRSIVYARHPRKIASDSRTPQTQKIQGVLALLFPVSLLGILIWRESAWFSLLILVAFGVTMIPSMKRYLRQDWRIAFLSPLLAGLAAFCGGAGIVLGMIGRRMQ
ncbi:MAG: glycosyltransferase [Chloroflexi bacterium]|nr:glycosyltransferase [Chloroflexota bacterium]